MTAESTPPSKLRRVVVALASAGLDFRKPVNRARNFLLRPLRHELEVKVDELVSSQATLARQLETLRVQNLREVEPAPTPPAQPECSAVWRAELDAQGHSLRREMNASLAMERTERRLRIAVLERLASTGPVFGKARAVSPGTIPLVSIVLPTFNRARFIADAIASVQAQSLSQWELIIVDDGSTDNTAAVVGQFLEDARIRFVQQPHAGCAAARNHGMGLTRGELIAHLDSDNLLFPAFLSEASTALQANPEAGVLYGILVSDSHDLGERCLLFSPFDRSRLMQGNFIDLNTVMHRRSLFEMHGGFDETLGRLLDWDLLLRYTDHTQVLALHVLAARYRICDSQRISDNVPAGPNLVSIRKKWHAPVSRPRNPRVLYVVWHYPQLSETYLEGEIRAMRRWGAHVELWRTAVPVSPYASTVPLHDKTLAEAIREARPDVIHVHWLSFALICDSELADLGLPVTIRMHGFDVTPERFEELLGKAWLHRVYAYREQVAMLEAPDARVMPVAVAFETLLFQPRAQKNRRLVVRTSATLPSKDIGLFFELAILFPQHRFVFAGVTCNGAEYYVPAIRALKESLGSPVELMFDVPRSDIAELVAQAGIYLHTIGPPGVEHSAPVGMPISIAEAMATGAHVLARELPALVDYLGSAGGTYRNFAHAAELIADTEAWTDVQWRQAWTRAVDQAFMNHADELVLRPIFDDWCGLVGAKAAGARTGSHAGPDAPEPGPAADGAEAVGVGAGGGRPSARLVRAP